MGGIQAVAKVGVEIAAEVTISMEAEIGKLVKKSNALRKPALH